MMESTENKGLKSRQEQLPAVSFYARYTILFILLAFGMYLALLVTGRSMVWDIDGKQQYYQQMVYLGNYLREFFSGLFHAHPAFRFYDFTIGLGEGIILAARLHRLDVLSVFFPSGMVSIVYSLVILLRLYLAGLTFSLYCRYRKMDDRAILIGVIVYLSSDFALRRVPMNPFFGTAIVMLPLMLLGVEKILEEGKCTCLILAAALGYLASYYYGYICTIAAGVYFLLRWGQSSCRLEASGIKGRAKVFLKKLLQSLASGALGILMVAWVLIPIFSHLVSSDRVQVEKAGHLPVIYPLRHLWYMALSFICPNIKPGYESRLHFIALVIPVLIIVYFERIQKIASLRLALAIQAAGLLFPVVGLVMGAFGSINNRWIFILSFSLAYATAAAVQSGPIYRRQTLNAMRVAAALFTLLSAGIIVFGVIRGNGFLYCFNIAVGCTCLAVSTVIILVINRKKLSYLVHCHALTACAYFSAVIMALITFLPALGGMAGDFMAWDELPSYYEGGPDTLLAEYTEDPFCRADRGYYHKRLFNNSLIYGYKGVSEFNSVMHAALQHYMMELENPGITSSVKHTTLDGSAIPENLASVHYYVADKGDKIVPYGFEAVPEADTGDWELFRNENPLSFAYTYDRYLPYEEYRKLSAAQKQQALMSAVVLDEEDIGSDLEETLVHDSPTMREISVPVHLEDVTLGQNASADENGYTLKSRGKLTFSCERLAGYEFYVRLTNLDYHGVNQESGNEDLYVSDSLGRKHTLLRVKEDPYYVPMKNRLLYMGYSDQDVTDEVTVQLGKTGSCQIGGIELIYLPADTLAEQIGERNAGGCSDPQVQINQVEGNLEDGEDRFVVTSVLYSRGWKAEVDGKPVPVLKANRCYTGFFVPAGAHHFTLTYSPPHFIAGIIISACAWLIFLMILLLSRIKNKPLP